MLQLVLKNMPKRDQRNRTIWKFKNKMIVNKKKSKERKYRNLEI